MPFFAFARDRDGGTVLEFALVLPVFMGSFLMIFEVAMMFGSNVLLEAATNNAARAVRTGQIYLATGPGDTVAQEVLFKDALCREIFLIDCDDLVYDVKAFNDFTAANADVNCNASGGIESPVFGVGQPAQIIVVTVIYPYQTFIPNPLSTAGVEGRSVAEGGCTGLPIRAVRVFRNEPFPRT